MLKTCSTAAALALIAVLAAPADAQSPTRMDAGRHAEMFGQPEHRLHSCRPSVDGVHLHPERANPAAGLLRCAQHDWAQHRHLGGRCVRLGRVGAHGWHTGRSARRRVCRRQRGHRPRPWCWRKRPDWGSGRTFALQPVSLEGSVAVDVALGVSALKLRPVP